MRYDHLHPWMDYSRRVLYFPQITLRRFLRILFDQAQSGPPRPKRATVSPFKLLRGWMGNSRKECLVDRVWLVGMKE